LPYLPRVGQIPPWAETVRIVPHQVRRDIEQLEHLVSKGVLGADLQQYVTNLALPEYRLALQIACERLEGTDDEYLVMAPREDLAVFFGLHMRLLHLHPGEAVQGEAINPDIDFGAVESQFLQQDHHAVVIDDFFTDDVLQSLRDFLLETTMWMDVKQGYVGAYLRTGFACPLLAQIDEQLRLSMPRLLGNLALKNTWAYMYDGSLPGIPTHADDSQVQINFFVTPTEANLWSEDSSSPAGGLVVFGVGPPAEWAFDLYNTESANPRIRELIASTGNWNVTVPYVQNRAVLFDSTYFHRSDDIAFKKGYKNRRINLTFLYGEREKLKSADVVCGA